jgi:hypothetical protein
MKYLQMHLKGTETRNSIFFYQRFTRFMSHYDEKIKVKLNTSENFSEGS